MKIFTIFGLIAKLQGEKKVSSEYIDILDQVRQNYDSTINPVLQQLPEIAPEKLSRAIRIQRIVVRYIDSLKKLPEKRKCVQPLSSENIEELQIQVTRMKNVGELFQDRIYSILRNF
ncbi:Oidioi.mRNA.OKI2018_I69.chr1.g968.t1.cds [Oikopleura dioica]|uniref:Oidioi.mRNA.OKI2018_I69.chr1.g968.t1.cds n=1 Tax=Oikopleura dioica TaxID=34765 RepID=A0ABN7SQQ7_OIKDI|nr:Oidioi.mRNA.OKI2018_I69.chr1.g968.t1.cds [Oikopleura dioica]